MFYAYEWGGTGYGIGVIAPWQQYFFAQSLGHVSDLEPLDDMTTWNAIRDFLYKFPVGMTGSSTGYCFTKASLYTVKVADAWGPLSNLYADWSVAYSKNFGTGGCTNTLEGSSGGAPEAASQGYYGNMLPALAYAVDHGAPGAAASWGRLTGATNWSVVAGSGFDSEPVWGIVPRGF